MCWDLIPNLVTLGSVASEWQLGPEGSPHERGWRPCGRDPREALGPFSMWGHSKGTADQELGNRLSAHTICCCLDFGLPAARTVRLKHLSLSHLVYGAFVTSGPDRLTVTLSLCWPACLQPSKNALPRRSRHLGERRGSWLHFSCSGRVSLCDCEPPTAFLPWALRSVLLLFLFASNSNIVVTHIKHLVFIE